ncbi:MAG: HAD hydrolase family protein [Treponema sp.]|nr:HAD hydrolase family protein [Treponema sp.]
MESGTSSENSTCSEDKKSGEQKSAALSASRAIFLDIDGTLISKNGGPYEEDLRQIQEARRRGHRFFLNTGRSLAIVPRNLLEAPYIDGIAAGGGAHILLKKGNTLRTVYHKWISGDLLQAAAALYIEMEKWCIFEGETTLYAYRPESCTLSLDDCLPVTTEHDFDVKYSGAIVTKLTMDGNCAEEKETALLGNAFHIFPQNGYHEAIIRGESKARAMEIILEQLGMSRSGSVAMGDSANDIDMIRFAGLGVAMGNACDELKQASRAVTAPCGEGGIALALLKYVL